MRFPAGSTGAVNWRGCRSSLRQLTSSVIW